MSGNVLAMIGLCWKDCDRNWVKMLIMAVCWLQESQKAEIFCVGKQFIEIDFLKVSLI